jgi:hypothetical protein
MGQYRLGLNPNMKSVRFFLLILAFRATGLGCGAEAHWIGPIFWATRRSPNYCESREQKSERQSDN